MQNAFPAGPLSLRGKFYVVEDIKGEHMIFSIDKRGSLCLVVKGANGHNELINLNDSFALSDPSQDHCSCSDPKPTLVGSPYICR